MNTTPLATREREAQRIEDVEDLLSWREPLEVVAARSGFSSVAAAGRYLRRHGRPDLSRPFEALEKRMRAGA